MNAYQSNDSYIHTSDNSDTSHEMRSNSSQNRTRKSNSSDEELTTLEHDVSSEIDIDPWSMIEIEKERKKG